MNNSNYSATSFDDLFSPNLISFNKNDLLPNFNETEDLVKNSTMMDYSNCSFKYKGNYTSLSGKY